MTLASSISSSDSCQLAASDFSIGNFRCETSACLVPRAKRLQID